MPFWTFWTQGPHSGHSDASEPTPGANTSDAAGFTSDLLKIEIFPLEKLLKHYKNHIKSSFARQMKAFSILFFPLFFGVFFLGKVVSVGDVYLFDHKLQGRAEDTHQASGSLELWWGSIHHRGKLRKGPTQQTAERRVFPAFFFFFFLFFIGKWRKQFNKHANISFEVVSVLWEILLDMSHLESYGTLTFMEGDVIGQYLAATASSFAWVGRDTRGASLYKQAVFAYLMLFHVIPDLGGSSRWKVLGGGGIEMKHQVLGCWLGRMNSRKMSQHNGNGVALRSSRGDQPAVTFQDLYGWVEDVLFPRWTWDSS